MNERKWRRRDFLKAGTTMAAAAALPGIGVKLALGQAHSQPRSTAAAALHRVRPIIGTGWHGHTFPGATAPFGLVQLSPDTTGLPQAKWNDHWDLNQWDHCAGYHYPDNVILGFSHTHLQGTGAIDLGDVLVMPLVEDKNWAWEAGAPGQQGLAQTQALGDGSGWIFQKSERGYRSFFSHDRETVRAGYYAVHLDTPDVQAELTATTRCGMHRYTFPNLPSDKSTGVVLDLSHSLGAKVYEAGLHIESNSRLSGWRYTHGWAKDKKVYFVLETNHPAAKIEVQVDGEAKAAERGSNYSGKEIRVILTNSGAGPLLVRVGISPTGTEGASRNLAAEIPDWDFDRVVREAEQTWGKELSAIAASFGNEASDEIFQTAAYHGLTAPAIFNDVDGAYRGQDGKNHPNPGFAKYTTISIWDIYRGEFPYLMLTSPNRIRDMIRTMLIDYSQLDQHSLPVWPLWANETWTMTGFHSVGMIAGAYACGFRDFDAEAAYAAMRDTAMVGATENNNQELQEQFRSQGYVVTGKGRQSVSRTLDFAYDYWSVGAMAEMLGKHDDAEQFYKLGQNYKNIFDPATGFMRGKTADGQWREPFRPDDATFEDYTESDAWQATFNVMQDVQGLIDLYGGDQPFIDKLDALFAAPSFILDAPPDISGLVGQDAQGNEPSNHIPYLYNFAGAPWKTQEMVRKVAVLYRNTPEGIPGNDDCGQTSTWFNFAALGFYPVNAVTGVYVIGSPLVNQATIRNPKTGARFVILAENNSARNLYIQSVELNGKRLDRSWLTFADIASGGQMRFHMGPEPNKEWGSAPEHRPPSGLIKTKS